MQIDVENAELRLLSNAQDFIVSRPALSAVPVPAAAYLFASGLPLLAGAARRKNKAKA